MRLPPLEDRVRRLIAHRPNVTPGTDPGDRQSRHWMATGAACALLAGLAVVALVQWS